MKHSTRLAAALAAFALAVAACGGGSSSPSSGGSTTAAGGATQFADLPDGRVSVAAQQLMAEELGADSLRYLPVEAIARAVSLSPERLCRACITGKYPSETGQRLYQLDAVDTRHANGAGGIRAYDLTAAAAVPALD